MAVFRVNKTSDYTVMSNFHLKDRRMSLKAKGLLSLILSLPDDWNYTIGGLVAICAEKEVAIKTALNELKDRGYLRVDKRVPTKANGGKYEYVYNIFEQPYGIQAVENQGVENQPLESQGVEPIPLYKGTNKSNTDKSNTDTPIIDEDELGKPTRKRFVPPTLEEIKAYCIERKNAVDAQKFYDYFAASDWYDSKGNKVKSWKQKVITWENNSFNNKPTQQKPQGSGNSFIDMMIEEGYINE